MAGQTACRHCPKTTKFHGTSASKGGGCDTAERTALLSANLRRLWHGRLDGSCATGCSINERDLLDLREGPAPSTEAKAQTREGFVLSRPPESKANCNWLQGPRSRGGGTGSSWVVRHETNSETGCRATGYQEQAACAEALGTRGGGQTRRRWRRPLSLRAQSQDPCSPHPGQTHCSAHILRATMGPTVGGKRKEERRRNGERREVKEMEG